MRVAIGADHAGFLLKEHLKQTLERLGHVVQDFGTDSEVSVWDPLESTCRHASLSIL